MSLRMDGWTFQVNNSRLIDKINVKKSKKEKEEVISILASLSGGG